MNMIVIIINIAIAAGTLIITGGILILYIKKKEVLAYRLLKAGNLILGMSAMASFITNNLPNNTGAKQENDLVTEFLCIIAITSALMYHKLLKEKGERK